MYTRSTRRHDVFSQVPSQSKILYRAVRISMVNLQASKLQGEALQNRSVLSSRNSIRCGKTTASVRHRWLTSSQICFTLIYYYKNKSVNSLKVLIFTLRLVRLSSLRCISQSWSTAFPSLIAVKTPSHKLPYRHHTGRSTHAPTGRCRTRGWS